MTHTLTQRLDMTADDTAPLSRVPERDGWWRRLLRDTGYTLTAFPIALLAFVVAVVGLSSGAATLVIGVGFVVLAGTLVVLRGFAHLERLRLRSDAGPDRPGAVVRRGARRATPRSAGCSRRCATRSRGSTCSGGCWAS